MPSARFALKLPFPFAGDQPQAVKKLAEGVKKGMPMQTLLGVTGSGKSLDYDQPIIIRDEDGLLKKVPIGEFVDACFDRHPRADSEAKAVEGKKILSFDPKTGRQEEKPIRQVSRHKENAVYRIALDDGSSVTVTGDHNCFRFQDGRFELLATKNLAVGDFLPLPTRLAGPEQPVRAVRLSDIKRLDIVPILRAQRLPEEEVRGFFSGISSGKYHAITSGSKERGLRQEDFLNFAEHFNLPLDETMSKATYVTRKRGILPYYLPITDDFLTLVGLYISEGNLTRSTVVISNKDRGLREPVIRFAETYDLGWHQNETSVFIHSTILSQHLAQFGCGAENKNTSDLLYNLSDDDLGIALRAVYDGDGWVESNGTVCLSSASRRLVFEIKDHLLRFGITSRIRSKKTTHQDAHIISVYGQENLERFRDAIGFALAYKRVRLDAIIHGRANTNVDVVPHIGALLRTYRQEKNMLQRDIASLCGCERSYISMIESGTRMPSKELLRPLLRLLSREDGLECLSEIDHFNLRRIVSIEKANPLRSLVYDLSVEGNENFIAGFGNIFVHNTFTMAGVIQEYQKPTLVLAHNKTLAFQLYQEFKELFPDNRVEFFISYYDYYQPESYLPTTDTYIEKDAQINPQIEKLRLAATSAVMSGAPTIIIASVSAIYGLGNPHEYRKLTFILERGQKINRKELLLKLLAIQYERNDSDLSAGKFRVKGAIVDFVPSYQDNVIRVTLTDDDTIASIAEYSPVDFVKVRDHESYCVWPAKHFVTDQETCDRAVEDIKEELAEWLPKLEAQNQLFAYRLKQRVTYDVEMIKEMGYCSGIENYSRFFDQRKVGERPYCLLDYFPEDFLLIIDESHQSLPQVRGMFNGDRSRKDTLVNYGFRLPSALDNRPLRFEEFEKFMKHVLFVSATPSEYEREHSTQIVEQIIRPTGLVDPLVEVRPTSGQVRDLIDEAKKAIKQDNRVLVTTLTKRMAEELTEYLANDGLKVRYLHSEIDTLERTEIIRQLRLGTFDILVGINLLREGLDIPEVGLVTILDADKEGFLRDERSLIQTIGRAARNIDAKVILYADRQTDAIKRTLAETSRRRDIQLAHNKKHNITPQTIKKPIHGQVVTLKDEKSLPKKEIPNLIIELEMRMREAAERLDFEEAIRLREQARKLKERIGK
jgi:excinuclease ABC B subunit